MTRKHIWRITALGIGAVMFFSFAWAWGLRKEETKEKIVYARSQSGEEMLQSPFKDVYTRVSPSVVGIEVAVPTSLFGGRISTEMTFAGSGVVISEEGYVLTNEHVVSGAKEICILSGDERLEAQYVAGDEESDIAVLKTQNGKIQPAVLGDSGNLSVGDWALVIGNPLGQEFANTLTVGVISGLDRDISLSKNAGAGAAKLIQTNAAINSGNSGGGLFNLSGELVGITSMKLSNNGYYGYASIEGIGFAIPSSTIEVILDELMTYGKVRYPYLGVTLQDISSPTMEPREDMLPASVWITSVAEGSPAQRAGLKEDDLILYFDSQRVTTAAAVRTALRSHRIGDEMSVTVYRIEGLREIGAYEPIPRGETLTLTLVAEAEE